MSNEVMPYQSQAMTTGVQANTDQQRAVAEVQASMIIARSNPRNHIAASDRIKNACSRPGLASSALYAYAKGGTQVTGPSIRLAEAIAQQWGNMSFGIRELDQRNGESTVLAYAWDIETNTRREVTFQVPHTRFTKKGSYKLEDPREIYELVANQGARRLRACILAVIPGDIVEEAVEQCENTLKATADTSPETIKKMVDAFATYQVTKDQLEKRIQRRLDAIQPAQVIALKKIYASLRDGMSVAADWFEVEASAEAAGTATDVLKDKLKAKATPATTQNQGETEPTPETPKSSRSCPEREAAMMFEEFCNGACKSRSGCPAWKDTDNA